MDRAEQVEYQFQSTRPRGARRIINDYHVNVRVFHSTPPAGGATWLDSFRIRRNVCYQSSAPLGRANRDRVKYIRACFNPRAAWGGDTSRKEPGAGKIGFQSTRPRGGDVQGRICNPMLFSFNPTRPRGRDLLSFPSISTLRSIHGPLGARPTYVDLFRIWGESFNTRARVGRR